jgi:hypothetical protein
MSCCDRPNASPLETLAAALTSLPRQLRGFAEVRRDLLKALSADPGALEGWRPSGDDFGLMWLEMWAYISDVLAFYDERTANETYIRTAVRRPSLRRIVELLGYTPSSGVAAIARVAAIADGVVAVSLPPATGFRSSAFGQEKPQVFETTAPWTIHPLKNKWTVISFKRQPTIDALPDVTDAGGNTKQKKSSASTGEPLVRQLLFETARFGLAADELVLFESRHSGTENPVDPAVSLVTASEPFEGKDSLTYIRVTLEPAVRIDAEADLSQLRARRPTQTAAPTSNVPLKTNGDKKAPPSPAVENPPGSGGTRAYFDLPASTFRRSDPMIVARNLGSAEAQYAFATIDSVLTAAVTVTSIPPQQVPIPQPEGEDPLIVTVPSPTVPAAELILKPAVPSDFVSHADELTFLYSFIDGGQPTNTGKTELGAEELSDDEGVALDGIAGAPPEAIASAQANGLTLGTNVVGVLEQEFLITDSVQNGALVDGRITFTADGRANFQALSPDQLPETTMRLPLTIYGNVIETTRGESVFGEVLGNGNGRLANQRFKLRKKPLTYLPLASADGSATSVNTLQIFVDGVLWSEVKTFFGTGAEDTVYTIRHDDEQNTFVTFGDGVRGARLPSGIKNVIASYRFGSGAAAPPAGSINQLAGAVKGLRSVRSPVAAEAGKDPDEPEQLRTNAPRSALLFGRAVSATDFEALAREQPGIVQAKAEWLWIDAQMQAGVVVLYIGSADPATVADALRAQADPTLPIEVTQAVAITASVSIGVEVDSRYVKETVAGDVLAFLTAPGTGVLSVEQARIGGTFWPSVLYEAIAQVEGVIAVSGVTFSTGTGGPSIASSGGTCIETGHYLDFSEPGSVIITGVDPLGSVAPIKSTTKA